MKIINNGYEVHETGSICCTNMEDTTFSLSDEPKLDVVFKIERNEKKDAQILTNLINEHTVAVIFENPPQGSYSHASPQRLGYFNGKDLYVNFHIQIMGDYQAYILTYTFLLKEAENG